MNKFVNIQIISTRKSLRTRRALERLFFIVLALNVIRECVFSCKSKITLVTLVRLLTCVSPHVHLNIVVPGKSPAAHRTLVLLALVSLHVVGERGGEGEAFATHHALVWLLTRVGAHVPLQPRLVLERVVAQLARVRLQSSVVVDVPPQAATVVIAGLAVGQGTLVDARLWARTATRHCGCGVVGITCIA